MAVGDFQGATRTAWATGVTLSVIVSVLSFAVFWLGSRKTQED